MASVQTWIMISQLELSNVKVQYTYHLGFSLFVKRITNKHVQTLTLNSQ